MTRLTLAEQGAWVDAFALALSRGRVLTLSLPVWHEGWSRAMYRRAKSCVRVTIGPYRTAVGGADWRMLGPAGEVLHIGDAFDVAFAAVRAAMWGVELGVEQDQARLDAGVEACRIEEFKLEQAPVCDRWLRFYRMTRGDRTPVEDARA